MNSMLYIVYGIGSDSVGLIGRITSPISKAGGNIVDMRQGVLHGLFTIYMVVDLGMAGVTVKEFKELVGLVSADTGVRLAMEKYTPIPRTGERKNMLLTLVGKDKPSIISAISEKLGRYNVNIESAAVVARENIFLMDLWCDASRSALPVDNLMTAIREIMLAIHINTMFQTENVFNKKKKVVLFDIEESFIDSRTLTEVMAQTGIRREDLCRATEDESDLAFMLATARFLENLPLSVIDTFIASIDISQDTHELLQTLKIMGYRIGLISSGFTFFTNPIRDRLGIDYAFGYELPVDDDAMTIIGELPAGMMIHPLDKAKIIGSVMAREKVSQEDITGISDQDMEYPSTPGIRLVFNLKLMLDLVNQHVLSRESLTGLLRSFGIPRL
ncbi:MAG: ACT domain-containing protein [Syntrophaceae bacterium]|nr:hypothetical protein [Deltaproteobacteria bacterium]